jgi:hypothetical protein
LQQSGGNQKLQNCDREQNVFAVSAVMVVWIGRVSGVLMLVSGTAQLFPIPPPPSIIQGLNAMYFSIAAMVPLTIGEFIAAYLVMLKAAPINPSGIDVVAKLQHQAFDVFRDGADSITKIFKATAGHGSSDRNNADRSDDVSRARTPAGLRSSKRKNEVSRERTPQP